MSAQTVPQPGFRFISGEGWMYSARWLNEARSETAMSALERARAAWRWTHDQLELPLEGDEEH